MPGGRRPGSYTSWQIALHWAIAALIGLQFVIQGGIELAFDDRVEGARSLPSPVALMHMATGASVLILASLRLALRLRGGAPPPPGNVPWPAVWLAHAVHLSLYLTLFALPLTGLWAWVTRGGLAAQVHEWGTQALLLLILAHVLGAAAEHLVFRNDALRRIAPFLFPGGRDAPGN